MSDYDLIEGIYDFPEDDLDALGNQMPPVDHQAYLRAIGILEGEIRDYKGEPVPIPKTDDELWEYVRQYVGIKIPRVKVCEHHVAPFTAFADAYFARSSLAIWEASRGFGGKSVLLATLAWFEAISLGAFVALLGGSTEQSVRVHSYMKGDDPNLPLTFWGCPLAPHYLLKTDPTARETRLLNGGAVKTLAASQKSVRGLHPQRLRVDEIDECELDVLDAALGQPMAGRGIKEHTVFSSTHHNPNGTMTEMKRRAPENDWKHYVWCYRESMAEGGWLDPLSVERKKKDITEYMWLNEYENQEPSPTSRAIMPEAVEAMFDKKLGIEVGHPYDTLIFEEPMAYCDSPMCVSRRAHNQKSPFEMPQRTAEEKRELIKKNEPVHQNCPECGSILKDAEYATGADWARKIDWTIIQTWRIDCNPMRLVCWYRGARQPWALMVEEYDWQIEKYNSNAAHDATGLGDVVAEMVRNPAEDVLMVGRERKDMISEYIGACERGEILMPHIEYVYTEHKFASVDDLFGTGHLPDTISSGAITLIAAGYGGSLAIAI